MLVENRVKVYIAAGVFILIAFINFFRTVPDRVEDVSKYPTMNYKQVVSLHDEIREQVKQPLSSFKEYFDVLHKITAMELAVKKYHRNYKPLDGRYQEGSLQWANSSVMLFRGMNEERSRQYKQKYEGEFEEARKGSDQSLSDSALYPPDPIYIEKANVAMQVFQFGFFPFAFMIFAIRIHLKGGSIFYEIAGNPFRFLFYLIVWEVGLFKYEAISLREQARRMLRFGSLVLTTVLSFGATTAKARTMSGDESEPDGKNSHTLVISGTSHYLSSYLGLDGAMFDTEPVIQSSLTIAHKSGLYASFWKSVAATHTTQSPNFGYEEDYTLGYSRKFGKRVVDSSLTYFNVTPLRSLPRGDLLQSSVMISNLLTKLPVSNYLWVRNVSPLKDGSPKGGWFVHFGASKGLKYRNTMLVLGTEAVFDSGAFGYKRAGIMRSSVEFKVPWRQLTFDLPVFRFSCQPVGLT